MPRVLLTAQGFETIAKAAPVKLTKQFVDSVPLASNGQQFYFYDKALPGFGLYVGKEAKTYFAERKIKGMKRRRRIIIGRHTLLTAEQARVRANKLLLAMSEGIDPVDRDREQREREERERAEAAQQLVTLKSLWEQFKLIRQGKLKPRTLKQYETIFNSTFADWLDKPVVQISRMDIVKKHNGMVRTKKGEKKGDKCPAYADSSFRVLRLVINYGIDKGILQLESNPVRALRGDWNGVDPRDRVLTPDELAKWFKAVDDLRDDKTEDNAEKIAANRVGADYLEFTLLTGLRRNESAQLRWDDVQFTERTLTIEDTKNGDKLKLPLSDHLITLLKCRKTEADGSEWVFPSPGRKNRETYFADPRHALEMVTANSGVDHRMHDLRRTFITVAEYLNISTTVYKRLVNHRAKKTGDVTRDHYVPRSSEQMQQLMRKGMEQITAYFLERKAAGQGMKLATGTGA